MGLYLKLGLNITPFYSGLDLRQVSLYKGNEGLGDQMVRIYHAYHGLSGQVVYIIGD
jgi:hypothetical protein